MNEVAVELAAVEGDELTSPDRLIDELRQAAAYLQVVADELEAIDTSDAERARNFYVKRRSMEEQPADDDEESEGHRPEPTHSDIDAALALGLSRLDEHHQAILRTEASWLQIADGTARTARALPAPRVPRNRYPELPTGETRVDLRF